MPASLLESQLALVEMDPTAYTYGMIYLRGSDLRLLQSFSLMLQSISCSFVSAGCWSDPVGLNSSRVTSALCLEVVIRGWK